jgi:V8-like Glu-specific endopeptidase
LLICPILAEAIYGTDDRQDWFEVNSSNIKNLASSIAVRVEKKDLQLNSNFPFMLSWPQKTLQDYGICKDVAFANQVLLGDCTASLINDEYLLTAGHCVEENHCDDYYWVFDYYLTVAGSLSPILQQQHVVECQQVVAREFEFTSKIIDYAVIKLKKPIVDRKPLVVDFNFESKLKHEDLHSKITLGTWGTPSGLPLKWTGNVKVGVWNQADSILSTNMDGFSGNSGGPVFDLESLKIIGVVSAGAFDWKSNENETCMRPAVISDNETIVPKSKWLEFTYLISENNNLGKFLKKSQVSE